MLKAKFNLTKKYSILIILIIFLLLVKLPIIFFAIRRVSFAGELMVGAIAKELINGPRLSFFDFYQYEGTYKLGPLVMGILTVPFFLVFGDSLFALKLVSLSFLLGMLIILYLLLYKYFNQRIAVITSILFILSPSKVTEISLKLFGGHFESIFFSLLIISIFYQIFLKRESIQNNYLIFSLWGLMAGFALCFSYYCLIALFTCLLFWFIFDERFLFKKNFLVFFISFIIGYSPDIYYNVSHEFKGIYIRNRLFFSHFFNNDFIQTLINFKNIIVYDLADAFLFYRGFMTHIYYWIFIFCFLVLFWSNRKSILRLILTIVHRKRFRAIPNNIPPEVFFLIYIVIFISAFSNFREVKYFFPLYPFTIVPISLVLDKIWNRKSRCAFFVFGLVTIVLVLNGFKDNINLTPSFKNFGEGFRYRGSCYSLLMLMQRYRNEADLSEALELINKSVDMVKEKYIFYETFGKVAADMYRDDITKALELINKKVSKEYRDYCYIGIGCTIGDMHKEEMVGIDESLDLINKIDEEYRHYCYKGFGRALAYKFGNSIDATIGWWIRLISIVDDKYKYDCYEGLGFQIGDRFGLDIDRCAKLINEVNEKYRPYCYRGLGLVIKRIVR